MSYLLTIRANKADIMDQMPAPWLARIDPLEMQFSTAGIESGPNKIVNAIVNNLYVGPNDTRVDDNGDLLERTQLPPSWKLMSQHEIVRGSDLLEYTAEAPVVIDAADITDTTIDHSRHYARYYVRPVYTGEVITGVILFDRVGNEIEQIDGVVPASDGSYTKTWTTPGKDVLGVGKVTPESLEGNGDYIHTPYTTSVAEPALVEMTTMDAEYINFMPDEIEGGGRPTVAAEISLFGGYRRDL